VRDADCIDFLQWALPRLGLRWPGYRKVRGQVCKRLGRRLAALALADLAAYRRRLEAEPGEWSELETLCHITISRFYRDRATFETLSEAVLPELAAAAQARGETVLRCWSAGCASGEEPYTLAMLWILEVSRRCPGMGIEIVASDAEPAVLARARAARYAWGSLKELPESWRDTAFKRVDGRYTLRPAFRTPVRFHRQDIRKRMPSGSFDLILCRNLAFTYFDEEGQRRVLERLARRLVPGGALVLGGHERLPQADGFALWRPGLPIWRRL
jgi:chemotaxis protein methyltransferase CheR